MQKSNAPTKLTIPFASGSGAGPVNTIPLTPGATTGTASYQTGFTSVNMEPIASGGVPPFGADFNGLFQDESKARIWHQAGYVYPFDATFAGNSNIGGYPAGSVLMMGSGKGLWINQSDNNTANPDATGSTGWLGIAAAGASTISTTGGSVTPDPSVLGVTTLIISGALTSNASVILPLSAGLKWIVVNNTSGSFTVTIQGATGTGVQVAQGTSNASFVFTDGTNYYATSANVSGLYLPINGNAVSASKLANARTIAMSGDVVWSVSFDGSSNVTGVGTIQNGSVTLAKMANLTANSLLGNPASSSATPNAITLGTGLSFSGTQLQLSPSSSQVIGWLGYTPVNKAGDKMTGPLTVGASAITVASTSSEGDVFISSGNSNSYCTYIYNNSVTGKAGINITDSTGAYNGFVMQWDRTTGATAFGFGASFSSSLSATSYSFTGASDGCLIYDASAGVLGIRSGTGTLYYYTFDASGNFNALSGYVQAASGFKVTSDRRAKKNICEANPRPIHKLAPYYSFELKETGSCGRGPMAQDVQKVSPEYVGEYDLLDSAGNPTGEKRLNMERDSLALEIAYYAAQTVDELKTQIAKLEIQLSRRK